MFADLAQKKNEEGVIGGSFGAKLGLRWGKGADLVPMKLEKGIYEKSFCSGALWGRTWKPMFGAKLAPRGRQDGEVGARMAASWGQEGAKSAKRRLEKRS